MNDELIENSNNKALVFSASLALLIHLLAFFSWSKLALEESAYAIGNPGRIEMVLSSFSQPEALTPQSTPLEPPKEIKAPSEFKKQVKTKPVAKKVAEQKPVAPVQKVTVEQVAKSNFQSEGNNVTSTTSGDPGLTQGIKAEPDYLNNPPPVYPEESRRRRETGVVLIFAKINAGGKVESLKISKSSGYERLDNAAFSSVKDWNFKPARFAGVAIESNVEIPVRFSLK